MAMVGFALHMLELLNWWNYLTQETGWACDYSNIFVCQVTFNIAGLNWSN